LETNVDCYRRMHRYRTCVWVSPHPECIETSIQPCWWTFMILLLWIILWWT
jgi:hypothetical protein